MSCATYLILFSVLTFIIRGSAVAFTVDEIKNLVIVTFLAAVIAGVALSIVAGITALGSGSAEGGRYAWRGAMFAAVMAFLLWFISKIIDMMPTDMPIPITIIFVGLPVTGLLWAILDKTVLKGND
jgi:hypothetical protein